MIGIVIYSFYSQPSETMMVWVTRLAQVLIAILACAMALSVPSIYYLFLLCSDFVYVVLWPQLLCCMYIRWSNSYGALAGYCIGLLVRLLGGEDGLGLPAAIGNRRFEFDIIKVLTDIFHEDMNKQEAFGERRHLHVCDL